MKVLVDTSVWIEHLRKPVDELINALRNHQVLMHSAVIGELACGTLRNRTRLLNDLALLPTVEEVTPPIALEFIERHRLAGKGLGWVDVQLLASAKLSGAKLFSRDLRLSKAAELL